MIVYFYKRSGILPYILLVFAKYPSFFCFQIHLNHCLYSISIADKKAIYKKLRQYRIILSADTASEVRQMLSQKRR